MNERSTAKNRQIVSPVYTKLCTPLFSTSSIRFITPRTKPCVVYYSTKAAYWLRGFFTCCCFACGTFASRCFLCPFVRKPFFTSVNVKRLVRTWQEYLPSLLNAISLSVLCFFLRNLALVSSLYLERLLLTLPSLQVVAVGQVVPLQSFTSINCQ